MTVSELRIKDKNTKLKAIHNLFLFFCFKIQLRIKDKNTKLKAIHNTYFEDSDGYWVANQR